MRVRRLALLAISVSLCLVVAAMAAEALIDDDKECEYEYCQGEDCDATCEYECRDYFSAELCSPGLDYTGSCCGG